MSVTYLEPMAREHIVDERYNKFLHNFGTDNRDYEYELEEKKLKSRGFIQDKEQLAYAGELKF